jgi:hypothetical protein
MPTKDYLAPAFGTTTPMMLGWLLEAVSEGESWLKAQPDSADWPALMRELSAPDPTDESAEMSNTRYNKIKRIYREHVASLNSFRHEGEFKPTSRTDLFNAAGMLTKLDRSWSTRMSIQAQFRGILQYAVGLGTAYAHHYYSPSALGPGRGDIVLEPLSPENVTFIQLPQSHDLQSAYAVIIREELPINLARAQYARHPGFVDGLIPDRDATGWIAKGLQKVQRLFGSPALRVGGTHPGDSASRGFPTVDIYHMYIQDLTVNRTGNRILMGPDHANWSYMVPFEGDDIPTGFFTADGQPMYRKATPNDCLLFPLRRRIIFSRTGVAYDGSSPWWHGQVPLARFRFNDNPWSPLGQSLVGDCRTMQQGVERLLQMYEDSCTVRLDPPMMYDENLADKSFADDFDPRRAGVRVGGNLQAGDVVKFPIPPEYYTPPQSILDFIRSQEDRMDYLSAARDLVALAKAKQIPAADSMEKLLEASGPIVKDLIAALAEPIVALADMRKAYYLQFYTSARLLHLTGADGKDIDVEFRPELINPIPSGEQSTVSYDRARLLLSEFEYAISTQSLNEIHRMQTKLFFLQLMKLGFPIDWWTFAEISEIPNFGPEPEGTKNVMERWMAQQRIKAELAGDAQQHMQQAGPGRPNSNQRPPQMKSKDGGSRTTVATS